MRCFPRGTKRKIPFCGSYRENRTCRTQDYRSVVPPAQTIRAGHCHSQRPRFSSWPVRHERAARTKYDRLIAEWLDNDRQPFASEQNGLTVGELTPATGIRPSVLRKGRIADARAELHQGGDCDRSCKLYETSWPANFGPMALRAVRDEMLTYDLGAADDQQERRPYPTHVPLGGIRRTVCRPKPISQRLATLQVSARGVPRPAKRAGKTDRRCDGRSHTPPSDATPSPIWCGFSGSPAAGQEVHPATMDIEPKTCGVYP